jgi:hypothetical protein
MRAIEQGIPKHILSLPTPADRLSSRFKITFVPGADIDAHAEPIPPETVYGTRLDLDGPLQVQSPSTLTQHT